MEELDGRLPADTNPTRPPGGRALRTGHRGPLLLDIGALSPKRRPLASLVITTVYAVFLTRRDPTIADRVGSIIADE